MNPDQGLTVGVFTNYMEKVLLYQESQQNISVFTIMTISVIVGVLLSMVIVNRLAT